MVFVTPSFLNLNSSSSGGSGLYLNSGNLTSVLKNVTDVLSNPSPLSLSSSQVAIGASGVSPYLGFVSSITGNVISAIQQQPSGAGMIWEGNNFNFGTYATGFYFGAGGTWVTPTARLHVRGDGANPIITFENNAGNNAFSLNNNAGINIGTVGANISLLNGAGTPAINGGNLSFTSVSAGATDLFIFRATGAFNHISGTSRFLFINPTIANAAGSSNFRPLNIEYTINNSGAQTGTATGIFLNATETALNGMTHNLMDLQINGVSQMRYQFGGVPGLVLAHSIIVGANQRMEFSGRTRMTSSVDGILTLTNYNINDFGRLQFGGTTNLFPALKRNGAGLEVRLADDSGFANLTASVTSVTSRFDISHAQPRIVLTYPNAGLCISNDYTLPDGSAFLELKSTTKGFLLPRMTTTQKNAIASPAAGLMVYDTTLNKLCVFTTVWETITSA